MANNNSGSFVKKNPDVSRLEGVFLRITESAWQKYLYARDYRTDEITLFGITKPEDPLFVLDFELIKQKVHNTSSDAIPGAMETHITANLQKQPPVLPINCDRIWAHTHPMTGEGSASPSGKDWDTFTDEDNRLKSFLVMLILSKSGHVTCHIKLYNDIIQQNTYHTIGIEIIKEDLQSARQSALRKIISEMFTQEQIDALNTMMAMQNSPVTLKTEFTDCGLEMYDPGWVTSFHKSYEELVSRDTFSHGVRSANNGRFGYISHNAPSAPTDIDITPKNAIGFLSLFGTKDQRLRDILAYFDINSEEEDWQEKFSSLDENQIKEVLTENILKKMSNESIMRIPYSIRSKTVIKITDEWFFHINFTKMVKEAIKKLANKRNTPSSFDLICDAISSGVVKFEINGKGDLHMCNDMYAEGCLETFTASVLSRSFYGDYTDSLFEVIYPTYPTDTETSTFVDNNFDHIVLD